ncbi:MAG TPA: antibiotic biosynthesis monooxygenase family protein [Sphingomonas sp.]
MITEIAQLACTPGSESALEAAFAHARPLFERAKGCAGVTFRRSIETPGRYLLFIEWETIENHMVDFRESADFQAWRALVTPHLAAAPAVEHVETLSASR